MKTKRILLLTLLLLTMVVAPGFSTNPTVKIKPLGNKSFALYLSDLGNQKHSILIKDSKGMILATQKTRKEDAYSKRFNLSKLSDGVYYLEVSDKQKTRTIPLNIAEENLAFLDGAKTRYTPIVKQTRNTMNLMVFSPDKSSYGLTVYNEQNEIVHDEILSEQTNYQKKIDFSAAAPGSYSVVINSQGQRYAYIMPVK